MAKPLGTDPWWDETWNPVGGCKPVSPGCSNCYAAQLAGTYTHIDWLHEGVTARRGTKRIFNGRLTVAPAGHPTWTWPLKWRGAQHPVLGHGKPSLIFVGDMSDLFHENRQSKIIDRVCATISLSEHIGLLLTKRTARTKDYFLAQDQDTLRRWQKKLWLGFSAERQLEFDTRWTDMRKLARAGWNIFVSVAPLLGPVTLPPDFLALGDRVWVIVAGEQGPHADCRDMDPDWARAIRDQCKALGIAFFFKQMARKEPIPPDLLIGRQFPSGMTNKLVDCSAP
jgi:protein gp37